MEKKLEDVDEYIEIIRNINYEAAEHGFGKEQIKKLLTRDNLFSGPLKLGLIGTGWITKNALYALKSVLNIAPHCIMSRDLTRAELFAQQHNVPHFTDNLFGLVVKGCNAVYVASQTQAHFSQVRNLLFLGIHVICEKPITVYDYEFNELANIAKKRGLILLEAWKTRHLPLFKLLKKSFNFANGISKGNENILEQHIKKLQFKFYYPIKPKSVTVDKSQTSLLRWHKNFCDIYFYPVSMAIALAGQADPSSFNIKSIVTGFTSTYALKCGWLSLYGDIEVQLTVAALYNEPNIPLSQNVILGSHGKITFSSITNIGNIKEYDLANKIVNEQTVDIRKQNFQYMIEEFHCFADLYYRHDLPSAFSLLRETGQVNRIMCLIFNNSFNNFSNKV